MSNLPSISFYLARGIVRIHRSTIDMLGNPRFVRLMVSIDEKSILLVSAAKKDFQSFRVPGNYNEDNWRFEIGCIQFCRYLTANLSWAPFASYRFSGDLYTPSRFVRFCLTNGVLLPPNNTPES
jgi:hypothetical protein